MRLTLGKKMGLGFGAILSLMAFSTGVNYVKSADIRRSQAAETEVRFPSITTARELQRDLNYTQVKGRQAILAGTETERWKEAKRSFDGAWSSIEKDMAQLDQLSPSWAQEDRDRLEDIKSHLPWLRETEAKSISHAVSGERDAVIRAGNENADLVTPANIAVKKSLDGLVDSMVALLAKDREKLRAANRSQTVAMGWISIVALGATVLIAIFLSRRISSATQSILARAQAIAAGDLTLAALKAKDDDELGDLTRAINQMQESLHGVIQSMQGNAELVATASEKLSGAGEKITVNSEKTKEQAELVSEAGGRVDLNLQTVASASEEMNATIGEIAKNATEAARVVSEAVGATELANRTVSQLGDSSAQIGKVIAAITSIARQTNLLALNATIEAARAGESGKGFAVVANEVKELAKQTAKATEEIKGKIAVIRENTGGAIAAIGGIREVIDKISRISSEIATAVEQQSATTSEMARNVTEAARGTGAIFENIKGVAASAQDTSTNVSAAQIATEHLTRMAHQLRDQTSRFKVRFGSRGLEREPELESVSHAAGAN
jgi:methyl-accepting chemotaxis protein